MRTLYVNGDAVESLQDTEALDDREGFRVSVEDLAISSGFEPDCRECSDEITEDAAYPSGYRHTNDPEGEPSAECDDCGEPIVYTTSRAWRHLDADDAAECDDTTTQPRTDGDYHDATPMPLGWCNSAAMTFDPEGESVTVSISVGDPRGAFAFTIRKMSDQAEPPEMRGRLIMHTPYPGEGWAHEETSHIQPGTLLVGTPTAPAVENTGAGSIVVTLTTEEAELVIAQRMEDAPGWATLARKIEAAR